MSGIDANNDDVMGDNLTTRVVSSTIVLDMVSMYLPISLK